MVTMYRPTSLELGSQTVPVPYVDDIDLPDDWGRCEPTPDGTRILVGEALGGAALLRTILHEAIHAISYAQGLDLKEKHVAGLEAGLSALLRLNPEFAKALTKHL